MTFQEFDFGVNRLKNCFGDRQYSEERMKVIWKEVKDLSGPWWGQTVDFLIGNYRQPPLLPEIRELISKEREKNHQQDKYQYKKQAEEFMSSFSLEDKKTILQQIRMRISGSMADTEFESFTGVLHSLGKLQCSRCQDTQLYFDPEINGNVLCNHLKT